MRGITSVLWGITSVLWRVPSVLWGITAVHVGGYLQYCGGYLQYCGGTFSTVEGIQYIGEITSVHVGDNISTVGDNISTVEGIQYSGGRILISACLVINNDEKISTFFVLRYEIFIRKFFENSSRFHAF